MKGKRVFIKNEKDKQRTGTPQQIADRWCCEHGAAHIDVKNRDIYLYDGGLFALQKVVNYRQKCIGFKKRKDGMSQAVFSKKRYRHIDYEASFWVEELDETIDYLNSMRRMLRKIGLKTNLSKCNQNRSG